MKIAIDLNAWSDTEVPIYWFEIINLPSFV